LIPFSYSSLKQFKTCARQYAEINIYKNYKPTFGSKQGEWGDEFHKAVEAYVKSGTELDVKFSGAKPVLDQLVKVPGTKYVEWKMGVRHDGTPCPWNSKDRWFQGIADLVVIRESPIAYCVDYKTGNPDYADTDQLELMAMLIFSHYPQVKLVKGALLFVNHSQIKKRTVDVSEKDRLWQKYREEDAKRVAAIEASNFPARRNGLCRKHCIVETCEHHGGK
jgi:hypothetical protein